MTNNTHRHTIACPTVMVETVRDGVTIRSAEFDCDTLECERCAADATTVAYCPGCPHDGKQDGHEVCANCATWSNSIDF